MKIAVLSDTHSRSATVEAALDLIAPHQVECIIHCGDIEDAGTVTLFPQGTHFVLGNCDMDPDEIQEAVDQIGATLHRPFGNLELAGRALAFLHGDDKRLQEDLERSSAFDFLFYGHTHVAREHRSGRTRVINPGALHRARPKSFIILDLATGKVEPVTVE
jgi:putative phosphoesterase